MPVFASSLRQLLVRHSGQLRRPTVALISSMACLVLMIALFAAFTLSNSHQQNLQENADATRNLATLVYTDVQQSIGGVDRVVQVSARLLEGEPELITASGRFLEDFVERQKYLRPEIAGIYLTDPRGLIVFPRQPPAASPWSVADQPYFQHLRSVPDTGVAIAAPADARFGSEPMIVLARAFKDRHGSLAGTVIATLPTSRYHRQMAGLRLRSGDVFALFDKDRQLVFRFPLPNPSESLVGGVWSAPTPLGQMLDQGLRQGMFRALSPSEGVDRMSAFQLFDHLPLGLLVQVSTTEQMQAWRSELNRTAVLVLAFVAFVALLTGMILKSWKRQTEERRLTDIIIDSSPVAIYTRDPQGRVTQWNAASEALFGWSAAESLARPLRGFSEQQQQESRALQQRVLAGETIHGLELTRLRKDGALVELSATMAPLQDSEGRVMGVVSIATDISERRRAESRVEHLAYHDVLTGLPNRALLKDRFAQAADLASRSQTMLALVFMDLDNFKTINDSLGHAVGDQLLLQLSERLIGCVRSSDTVCRHGGDEFLMLLQNLADVEAVSATIEKVQAQVRRPFVVDGHELSCSLSMGVAMFPADGTDFEALLREADIAMYQAKDGGKDMARFFDPTMDVQAHDHLLIRNGLRTALEQQHFELHYQPQFDLDNGQLTGVEALIRWRHPEQGLIAPGRFIPVAEDSGLIVPIGAWVLREACRQAVAWRDAGLPPMTVAVNLSAIQFKRGQVECAVNEALQASGLAPGWLELELTESTLIQDSETVLASVMRLKAMGVQISIDDFGTGYSSFAYLKRFAVDKLKIDQSFVRSIMSDKDDAAIVQAIISMARSLGVKSIAEGIETGAVADCLKAMGCDEAQGYFFARPMPAAAFEAFASHYSSGRPAADPDADPHSKKPRQLAPGGA
jgi:diguanylate cyclase (GGDEF)-like protein/PAS domain S-box-containing protein